MALKDMVAKKKATVERARPQSYSLADETAAPPKVASYSFPGKGKTFLLIGMLLNGERVFVLSTDFGSNGLATVRNELKRIGRSDLLVNVRGIDLSDYDDIEQFCLTPSEFAPGIAEWKPTVMTWDGFTSFNVDIVDEHILKHTPGAENAGELRYAGFTHTQQDWSGTKRGTVRTLRKFLASSIPDVPPMAKYVTCLEAPKADIDPLTGKPQRHPLIQGSARGLFGPGFDVITQMYSEDQDGKIKYFYRFEGDEKYLVKSRGYPLKPVEEADPVRIWKIIRETGGGFAEEVKG
jgi:hypothetical protein